MLQAYLDVGTRWVYAGPPVECWGCSMTKAVYRYGVTPQSPMNSSSDVDMTTIRWHEGVFCDINCYIDYHVETRFPSRWVETDRKDGKDNLQR